MHVEILRAVYERADDESGTLRMRALAILSKCLTSKHLPLIKAIKVSVMHAEIFSGAYNPLHSMQYCFSADPRFSQNYPTAGQIPLSRLTASLFCQLSPYKLGGVSVYWNCHSIIFVWIDGFFFFTSCSLHPSLHGEMFTELHRRYFSPAPPCLGYVMLKSVNGKDTVTSLWFVTIKQPINYTNKIYITNYNFKLNNYKTIALLNTLIHNRRSLLMLSFVSPIQYWPVAGYADYK